jgi:SAM-dependent methyltransferase
MHLDVSELSAFYLSPLGRIARQIIRAEVRAVWPSAAGERLAGVGHATPYLRPYLGEAERVLALMPAAEGVLHWPPEGPNVTALAYEDALPLPDNAVDKLLLVHLLEAARDPSAVLREAWRILMPAGRLIAVVPHRSGAWARSDHTPMGLGRPFSRSQLCDMLDGAWLKPVTVRRCLFVPPSRRRFVLGATRLWEGVGRQVAPALAGMLVVEAEKIFVRGIPVVAKPRALKITVPGLAPVPKPAAHGRFPHAAVASAAQEEHGLLAEEVPEPPRRVEGDALA